MIPILYLRSSSISDFITCQQKYFLGYTLGFEQSTNIKTEWGSCTHRILECIAQCKKLLQEGKNRLIDKEIDVDITFSEKELLLPTQLNISEIDLINSTRINKDIYKIKCHLPYGHIRYGKDLVEYFIDKCLIYYKSISKHKWQPIYSKHIANFTWIALEYQNGICDPRKRTIIGTEKHFDFEIKEDWAQYDYNGHTGYLRLKGTIDLTLDNGNNLYEICDWKTGSKKNWTTNEPKTYKSLHHDPQLLMYHYVANKIYPNKDILVTIFYLRECGPYSLCFSQEHIQEAIDIFKNTFDQIRNTKLPELLDPRQKHQMCRFCDFSKKENLCHKIYDDIVNIGINRVIEENTQAGHTLDKYDRG